MHPPQQRAEAIGFRHERNKSARNRLVQFEVVAFKHILANRHPGWMINSTIVGVCEIHQSQNLNQRILQLGKPLARCRHMNRADAKISGNSEAENRTNQITQTETASRGLREVGSDISHLA